MAYSYADIRNLRTEPSGDDGKPEAEVPAEPAPAPKAEIVEKSGRSKRAKLVKDFVQVKLSRDAYSGLKTLAGLCGKSAPEMLEDFVRDGLSGYQDMTIRELLSR